jgi:hypothetical protein
MTCRLCIERGKTWSGGDPKCAFDGKFEDNWNCATLNSLRNICKQEETEGIYRHWCDGQSWAAISIDEIRDPDNAWIGYTLWMTWYKHRGRTEQAYILSGHSARQPTESECLSIISYYTEEPEE